MRLSREEIHEIFKIYNETGSYAKTVRETGHCPGTVRRHIRGQSKTVPLSNEQIQEVIKRINRGETFSKIHADMDIPPQKISEIARTSPECVAAQAEKRRRLFDLFSRGFSLTKIGKEINLSRERVRQILASKEICIRRRPGMIKKESITRLLKEGKTIKDCAETLGISNYRVLAVKRELTKRDKNPNMLLAPPFYAPSPLLEKVRDAANKRKESYATIIREALFDWLDKNTNSKDTK